MDLKQKLNEEQSQAVSYNQGPLLIIAGAGTGKTKVITTRIINIIEQGWAKPSEILALTFTDKASKEMLDRVDNAMPLGYEEVNISTFHSFCEKLLRQEALNIGLDINFTLMTQAQAYMLFRKNLYKFPLKKLRPMGSPSSYITEILKHFSRLQDEDVRPEDYINFVKELKQDTQEEKERYEKLNELAETYKMYSQIKIDESKLDFGDVINLTLKLLRESPITLKKYRKQYKYILVDEFQDTNFTQNVLINTLAIEADPKYIEIAGTDKCTPVINKKIISASSKSNITVVGDDDQAIYKFRGAAISNILQFKKIYPSAKNIVLTKNYRNEQKILDSAYSLISNNNPHRLEITENINKKLVANKPIEKIIDDPVKFIATDTGVREAEVVSEEILKLTGNSNEAVLLGKYNDKGQSSFVDTDTIENGNNIVNYNFSDIAILVRANKHIDEFVQAFKYKGIPFKFVGPRGLYNRPEVGILISFFKVLSDFNKNVDAYNLLIMDCWHLSGREVAEIMQGSRRDKMNIINWLEYQWGIKLGEDNYSEENTSNPRNQRDIIFSKEAISNISNLLQIMDYSLKMVKENRSIGNILLNFFKQSGYMSQIANSFNQEDVFKMQNISKYFDTIKKFEQDSKVSNLYDYIDYLNYSIEIGESPSVEQESMDDLNAVNIMTVHSSKGLEFPVVFLVNLSSERFPSRYMSDRLPIPEELIKEVLGEKDEKMAHLQEERRLFYVGATRAKEMLYLTTAENYGGVRKKSPSIFIEEILNRNIDLDKQIAGAEKGNIGDENEINGTISRNINIIEKSFSTNVAEDEMVKFLVTYQKKKLALSFTAFNQYRKCPKQYRYKYLQLVPGEPSASQTYGRVIHNTLKSFYDMQKQYKESLPGIVQMPDFDFLQKCLDSNWVNEGYDSIEQRELQYKRAQNTIKQYFEKLYSIEEYPIDLERRFSYNIIDLAFNGAIDRIDKIGEENGKNLVTVIDYKTGEKKEDKDSDYQLQLALYALVLEESQNLLVKQAKIIYLDGCEVLDVEVDEKVKAKLLSLISEVKNEILSENFIAKPGFMCKYCDYLTICDEAYI